MSSDKTLILVRHAHRHKFLGAMADNGLSLKGKRQARKFEKCFSKQLKNKNVVIYSSPKKRCVETVKPLALALKLPYITKSFLSERGQLSKKINRFVQEWKKNPSDVTIACSHGDWIPEALNRFVKRPIEIKKGGFAILIKTKNGIRLKKVVQKL